MTTPVFPTNPKVLPRAPETWHPGQMVRGVCGVVMWYVYVYCGGILCMFCVYSVSAVIVSVSCTSPLIVSPTFVFTTTRSAAA